MLMDDSLPVDKLLSADGLLSVNDSLPVDKLLSAGQLLSFDTHMGRKVDFDIKRQGLMFSTEGLLSQCS
jgi:hypothetical protein